MNAPQPASSTDLGPSISCFPSGNRFHINQPTFDIGDIAHALGMMCRYNGHVRHFYTVAEHSVIVSLLMQELKLGDPMEGLLHDGAEAYVPDMVSGWKNECAGWRAFEHRVEKPMRAHFGLPQIKSHGCQQADSIAFYIEWHFLKADPEPTHGHGPVESHLQLKRAADKLRDAGWRVMNLYPPEATAAFMKRYNELARKRV